MTAGEKLSTIMELFGVSTRRLALAIHVDPSSVSRWANGKRALRIGSELTEKIVEYFLSLKIFSMRKPELVELLLPGATAETVDSATVEMRFREWLLFDDRSMPSSRRVDSPADDPQAGSQIRMLLGNLGELSAVPPPERLPSSLEKPQPGAPGEVEIYFGDEGIRQALLSVASAIISHGEPAELLITSQDDLSWYLQPDFLPQWMHAVSTVLRTSRVRVIFRLNRGMGSILTLIRSWLPLILTGCVEARYYSRYEEPVVAMTLAVVPGLAAMFSMKSVNDDAHGCTYLHRDAASVEYYHGKFLDLVSVSQPLIRVFGRDSFPALQRENALLEERRGDFVFCSKCLNPLLIPDETFLALLHRTDLDESECGERLEWHRRRRVAFREAFASGRCRDICSMEAMENMASHRGFRYESVDLFYSGPPVPAAPEDLLAHLGQALDLLQNEPNYSLALTSLDGAFEDHIHYWHLKADAAAVVCARSPRETYAVECREGTVLQGFEDYFNSLWDRIPPVDRDRELVKRRILDRMERIGKIVSGPMASQI